MLEQGFALSHYEWLKETKFSAHFSKCIKTMTSQINKDLMKKIQKVRRALRDQHIEKLEFESELDSAGEPSVWIWIVFKRDTPPEVWNWENKQRLRSTVIDELKKAGVTDWPYVHFRSADEAPVSATVSST